MGHRFFFIGSTRVLIGLLLMVFAAIAMAGPVHAINRQAEQQFIADLTSFEFSPQLKLTSNYVWRGVSQSANHPATQGDFLLHDKLGLYTGLFGTNTNFTGTNGKPVTSEFQLYGGYKSDYAGVHYDVGVRRYVYPNAIGPDFTEGFFFLGYGIFKAGIARSNEVPTLYGDGGTYHGTYYSANALYELPFNVGDDAILSHIATGAHIGHYTFSSSNLRDNNYTDYQLSIAKTYKSTTLELAWTDTNNTQAFLGQRNDSILALSMIVCF